MKVAQQFIAGLAFLNRAVPGGTPFVHQPSTKLLGYFHKRSLRDKFLTFAPAPGDGLLGRHACEVFHD
jgi:hypothetical protein